MWIHEILTDGLFTPAREAKKKDLIACIVIIRYERITRTDVLRQALCRGTADDAIEQGAYRAYPSLVINYLCDAIRAHAFDCMGYPGDIAGDRQLSVLKARVGVQPCSFPDQPTRRQLSPTASRVVSEHTYRHNRQSAVCAGAENLVEVALAFRGAINFLH